MATINLLASSIPSPSAVKASAVDEVGDAVTLGGRAARRQRAVFERTRHESIEAKELGYRFGALSARGVDGMAPIIAMSCTRNVFEIDPPGR